VIATTLDPFYTSTCSAVACPANATGNHVPAGCSCNAGFAGVVLASTASPFYITSCSGVACPANSNGADVPSGCSCNAGYAGSVSALTTSPFYSSSCSAVVCPTNSMETMCRADVPAMQAMQGQFLLLPLVHSTAARAQQWFAP
jgi:hypothetical protein